MGMPLAQLILMQVGRAHVQGNELPGPSYLEAELIEEMQTELDAAKAEPK